MSKKHLIFLAIMVIVGPYLLGCGSLARVMPQGEMAQEKSAATLEPVSFTLAAASTPTTVPTVEVTVADLAAAPAEFVESQAGSIKTSVEVEAMPTASPVVEMETQAMPTDAPAEAMPAAATMTEAESQPVVSTAEEPGGTIYFVADKIESLGYFDPVTGGSVDLKVDGIKNGIYKIRADGANLTQIHPSMANDNYLVISPDGQKMLYQVEAGHDIYLSSLDGSNPLNLTNSPDLAESSPVWLPDGQRIVYLQTYDSFKHLPGQADFSDIYVLDVNQATPLNLTNHPPGRHVKYGYAVSPNGQQVIFVSSPAGDMGPPPPGLDFKPGLPETLSVINLDGFGRLDLIDTPPGYELGQLSWSPDSQRIALMVGVQQEDGGFRYDVHLLNPDGTQPMNMTNTPDAFESNPVWSPNGQQLVVSCDYSQGGVYSKNETTGIQFFGRDGIAQTTCIDLPNTYAASGLKWSPDGQRVAIFGERYFVDGKLLSSPQTMLFTIKIDGTDLIQIPESDMDVGDFAWSPEGQWLAFSARPRISKTGSMFTSVEEARSVIEHRIYVAKADSSRIIPLTEDDFGHIKKFEWQP